MTRHGVQRLLALVLALAVVSIVPTVVANLVGGRVGAPVPWSVAVLTAYAAVLGLLLVQAVRRGAAGVPAWALVVVGNLALATYPLVARDADDDVPWVLALSPVTVGAGAVATPSLAGALALTGLHLGLRLALQLSGVWTVPVDVGVQEAVGLLVIATAASVAVLSVRGAARQVEAARTGADRAAAAAAAARAVELENSRWDGIVHDDVLASLSLTAHVRDDADRLRARAAAARALASIDHDTVAAGPTTVAEAVGRLHLAVLDLHPAAAVELPAAPAGALDEDTLDALSAATVEACRNALRHGGSGGTAPAVRVRVRVGGGRLRVEVRDDGAGFDPRTATPRLGLALSVRRRADLVGGRALVRSAPGVGTVVLLSVPVREEDR
ncbi:ATP-binding protein [Kineococcus rhizosphaerae]|uniref:Signal transduction histidine kinase n=1 Tax=Kineococcus rhizosphaerae TaxID=559628 RepID=A0A2T0R4E1_9ACTN|nr:ATP-binding protein [Kineococcus rhizosphaerae]PRY15225.1 signal transduction histidine kinase [Kineococcus rhizosphaerae]